MNEVVIIGAGKIGSRHLQAMAHLKIEANIHVVDLNESALSAALELYNQMELNPCVKSVNSYTKLSDLKCDSIDLAIISTTANIRRKVIEELVFNRKIKAMVLEKILFQKIEDYTFVENIINKNNIKAWVNCPRRMWEVYSDLKKALKDTNSLDVTVVGNNWSIATSSVHFLDLISFLNNKVRYQISKIDIDEVVPAYSSITGSRESEFVEFFGIVSGYFDLATKFRFICLKNADVPFVINIVSDRATYQILEEYGLIVIGELVNDKWEYRNEIFKSVYQSNLSNLFAHDILTKGKTDLTPFNESCLIHKSYIKSLILGLSEKKGFNYKYCPVT